MRKLFLEIGVAIALVLPASLVGATTLDVVAGKLVGASNINVDGTFLNVEFLDGTCGALFSGCNEAIDFVFADESAASTAAQALVDEVFINVPSYQFDDLPDLISGCNSPDRCEVYIPTGTKDTSDPTKWDAVKVINYGTYGNLEATYGDPISTGSSVGPADETSASTNTWARFSVSPIPEPSTALLLTLGLAGLGLRRRVR